MRHTKKTAKKKCQHKYTIQDIKKDIELREDDPYKLVLGLVE